MNEKNFLERWSRLKRDAAQQREKGSPAQEATERAREHRPGSESAAPAAEQAAFDPASLPPLESITAVSDIRAFLAPNVPAALTHAALRRAWVADPAIRDFVGLSENAWDFTDPSSIPGFGGIGGSEELRRLVAHLTDGPQTESETRSSGVEPDASEASQLAPDSTETPVRVSAAEKINQAAEPAPTERNADLLQHSKADGAPQNEADTCDDTTVSPRRSHGRALPE